MMYPFLTLDEKDCFHHAECILLKYERKGVFGFSEADLVHYEEVIRSTAHLILRFAQEGGFDSAAGF